jgi:hypothetical protein
MSIAEGEALLRRAAGIPCRPKGSWDVIWCKAELSFRVVMWVVVKSRRGRGRCVATVMFVCVSVDDGLENSRSVSRGGAGRHIKAGPVFGNSSAGYCRNVGFFFFLHIPCAVFFLLRSLPTALFWISKESQLGLRLLSCFQRRLRELSSATYNEAANFRSREFIEERLESWGGGVFPPGRYSIVVEWRYKLW